MIRRIFALLTMAALATPLAAQEPPAMSASELARCASQVQTLRAESIRLNQVAAENRQRREALAALRATTEKSPENLVSYNRQATEFNAHMDQFRSDVTALNVTKDAYDRACANRSYRRADFNALPQDKQAAMQAGLADIRVPQLESGGAN